MKEVTVKVPNENLDFFIELIEQLDIEIADQIEIPEEHKRIVRERIKKSKKNPERLLDWDEVKDDFKLD